MIEKQDKSSIINDLDVILNRIKSWDNKLESAIEIIESNEIDIKKIQEYDFKRPQEASKIKLDKDYQEKIKDLEMQMKCFLEKVEEKKQILIKEKKQESSKNSIITNYISWDLKAVFIDKDV